MLTARQIVKELDAMYPRAEHMWQSIEPLVKKSRERRDEPCWLAQQYLAALLHDIEQAKRYLNEAIKEVMP